jgi:hypothetical protein
LAGTEDQRIFVWCSGREGREKTPLEIATLRLSRVRDRVGKQ